jgi:putative membrane protein
MNLVKQLLIGWLVIAAAIGLAAALLDSVTVHGGLVSLLGVALVFALVHLLLGPILKLLTLPITVATLGLFLLVVNALLLAITAGISDNLDVGGPLGVILAALVISVIEWVLGFVLTKLTRTAS